MMRGNRTTQVIMCLLVIATMVLAASTRAVSEEIKTSLEHEAGFYYTIQKGDTLWDLSDSFFDSPWFWPELWKENDQIPNPHWIYPGERIRLFQKKGTDTFSLMPPEPESVAVESAASTEMKEDTAIAETVYYMYPSIDTVGFIRKEPVQPLGFIFKSKGDKVLINEGDTIYLNYADKEGAPVMQGSRYTVYRRLNPSNDRKLNKQLGGQYYVIGIVEVVQMEEDYFMAKVVKSFHPIEVDDFILPFMMRSPKIPITASVRDLVGKILLSEDHQELIGDFTTVFIDKGTEDQVKPGQIYSIFYQEKEEIETEGGKPVLLNPVDYGKLIVLHTEKNTSTVLITQTDRHAFPGALIRTPAE